MCCVWKLDFNLETRGSGRVSHILAEMGIQFIGGPKLQRDRRLLKNFCEMTWGHTVAVNGAAEVLRSPSGCYEGGLGQTNQLQIVPQPLVPCVV